MSATVAPPRAADEHVALAAGQRRRAAGEGRRGEGRVDDPLAGGDAADGVGELLGRGVLDDEAERAGLHRPAQVPGPAERGEDDDAAARQLAARARRRRRGRRGRASRCRAARRRAGAGARRRPPRRRARPRRRPRSRPRARAARRAPADERLVVGQEQPQRHGSAPPAAQHLASPRTAHRAARTAGTLDAQRHPAVAGAAVTVPPAAATRSPSPCRPLPAAAAAAAGRRRRSRASRARS